MDRQATRCERAGAPFHYCAYGLSIASDFEFPHLPSGEPQAADVVVRRGRVPDGDLLRPGYRRKQIYDQLRYEVIGGREVVIEPLPEARGPDVADLIVSRLMTVILYQRGRLPLHASAVATLHGAIAICGLSGAGKSTLAACLASQADGLVADDTLVAERIRGCWTASVSAIGLKLSAASLALIGSSPAGLALANAVEGKYFRPSQAGHGGAHRICALIQLQPGPAALSRLTAVEAATAGMTCIRMPDLIPESPDQSVVWRQWLELVQGVPSYRIAHGGRLNALPGLARDILEVFRPAAETGVARERNPV